MYDVTVIGPALIDVLAAPFSMEAMARDSRYLDQIRMSFGGDALNESAVLTRLGKKVQLISKVGADEAGSPRTGSNILCVIYSGKKESSGTVFVPKLWDDASGIAVNVFWEPQEVTLPELPDGVSWYAAADTSGALIPEKCAADGAYKEIRGRKLTLGPRSVIVFTARA